MIATAAKILAKRALKGLTKKASNFAQKDLNQFQPTQIIGLLGGITFSFWVSILPIIIVAITGYYAATWLWGQVSSAFTAVFGNGQYLEAIQPATTEGTCPLPGGYLSCDIYGGGHTCNHGDNAYWDFQSSACAWALPVTDPNCQYNQKPGSVCNDTNYPNWTGGDCPHYGVTVDFMYPDGSSGPVYMPTSIGDLPPNTVWHLQYSTPPGEDGSGHCGWNGFYQAAGHPYEIYFEHLSDEPPSVVAAGERISTGLYNEPRCHPTHLHLEVKINGQYVDPSGFCDGTGVGPSPEVTGYYATLPVTETQNIVVTSSDTSGYFSPMTSCAWANLKNLDYAVNGNYYRGAFGQLAAQPISLAGDLKGGGKITSYPPDDEDGEDVPFSNFDWGSFAITNQNSPSIFKYETPPSSSQYTLAVSGVDYSNDKGGRRNHTALGVGNGKLILLVLEDSLPGEVSDTMASLGADPSSSFLLDSGGSSTFCQKDQTLVGTGRPVPVSVGFKSPNAECFRIENGSTTPCN